MINLIFNDRLFRYFQLEFAVNALIIFFISTSTGSDLNSTSPKLYQRKIRKLTNPVYSCTRFPAQNFKLCLFDTLYMVDFFSLVRKGERFRRIPNRS